jgi:hypothetical protein
MAIAKSTILWLMLALACFLPASALTPSAPENCVSEIFSIGYDAPTAEATDLGSSTETSTSDYDTAPIRGAITEDRPTEASRALFGQNAEFKAADTAAPDLFRGTTEGYPGSATHQALGITPTSLDPATATIFATESATSSGGLGVVHIASSEGLPLAEENALAAQESAVNVACSSLPHLFRKRPV